MSKIIDYEFKRGDTKALEKFKVTDKNGEIITLGQEDKIFFTFKKNENGVALIKKSIGNGITLGEDGYYHIILNAGDTANLQAGTYKYDIELDLNNNPLFVSTLIEGEIELLQDVTQEGDRV